MLSEPEPTQAEPPSSVFGSATSQSGLHGPTNKRARPPHRIEGNLSKLLSLPVIDKHAVNSVQIKGIM